MLRMCFIREMSERERESSCRMYRAARMASGWEEEGEKKKKRLRFQPVLLCLLGFDYV